KIFVLRREGGALLLLLRRSFGCGALSFDALLGRGELLRVRGRPLERRRRHHKRAKYQRDGKARKNAQPLHSSSLLAPTRRARIGFQHSRLRITAPRSARPRESGSQLGFPLANER